MAPSIKEAAFLGQPYPGELNRVVRWSVGVLLTLNFLAFWAIPIFVQGQTWKQALQYVLSPIYRFIDRQRALRVVAEKFIYSEPRFADFFFQGILVTVSFALSFGYVLHTQLTTGTLSWGLIFAYYFAWVGFGGRVMGGAYTFAHKEGHLPHLYQPWIRNTLGNFFENWLGCFYGNVPYNFTTSHIAIHHKLNAGRGDTFYQWDLDRSSWGDFMLFLHRILLHTTGFSSLAYFVAMERTVFFNKLLRGCIIYWLVVPGLLLLLTHSWSFLFFIYLQPLLCMSYFLAFMNFAFHAFVEFDEHGAVLPSVGSTTIIEGDDDYFGEDDHMAHHNATRVYWRDLKEYQSAQHAEFARVHASVFRKLSIVEMAFFLLFKDWKRLAEHYVDYSGKLSKEEIAKMLEVRAKRLDMPLPKRG